MAESGFCTECGARVASFEGLSACPACGTDSVPCRDADQVTVQVNWHELRLLCIWAENWQRRAVTTTRVVYSIAKRLRRQHPNRSPLTLAEELGEVAGEFQTSVSDPKLRRDIAEQTGRETGLFRIPAPGSDEPAQPRFRIYLARDRDGALDVYWTAPDVDVETGRWLEPVTQESLDAEQLLEELVPEMHCREFLLVPAAPEGDRG